MIMLLFSVCVADPSIWRQEHKAFYSKQIGYKKTIENGCWDVSEDMKFINPGDTTPMAFEEEYCDVHVFETKPKDGTQRFISVFDSYRYRECTFDRVMRWMVAHIHEYSVFYDSKAHDTESEECFVRVDFGSEDPRSPLNLGLIETVKNKMKNENTMNLNANIIVSPWQAKCLNGPYTKSNGEERCEDGKKETLGHQIKAWSKDPAANISKLINPMTKDFNDMTEFSLKWKKGLSVKDLIVTHILPNDMHHYNLINANCWSFTDKLFNSLKEKRKAKADNQRFHWMGRAKKPSNRRSL